MDSKTKKRGKGHWHWHWQLIHKLFLNLEKSKGAKSVFKENRK